MKIGKTKIIINNNINKVKNDFEKLTSNDHSKYFNGEINDNYFHFTYISTARFAAPELEGELIENEHNKTTINLNIIFPNLYFIINIFWLLIFIILFFTNIFSIWPEQSFLSKLFLIFVVFGFPIINCIYFKYALNNMIIDFSLYENGFFDKYLSN